MIKIIKSTGTMFLQKRLPHYISVRTMNLKPFLYRVFVPAYSRLRLTIVFSNCRSCLKQDLYMIIWLCLPCLTGQEDGRNIYKQISTAKSRQNMSKSQRENKLLR